MEKKPAIGRFEARKVVPLVAAKRHRVQKTIQKGNSMNAIKSSIKSVDFSNLEKCYKPRVKHVSFTDLPFISATRGGRVKSHWVEPSVDSYKDGCEVGEVYAAHFVQYLRDNPYIVGTGLLSRIIGEMDFDCDVNQKGCWVGFLFFIESILCNKSCSVDTVDVLNGIIKKRDEYERGQKIEMLN